MRFPEFTDEWKESVLSDFVERVKRKNKNNLCKLPLTISAQYGLVDQISFFNKVIASENMSNYYLLHKGDFAYNKSYSSEYPWGAIKRLDCYEQGTLSSLYICFKPYSHVSSDFLTHYFETSKWHQGISEIAVEGARNHGLLNVGIQDFFETRHCLPQSLLEQEKIAKFLNLIEERIATQNKIIEDLKKLKSAISERLFKSVKGSTVLLSDLCDIVKGKQINGENLSDSGNYYVMNGGTEPSGYYDNYNVEASTISISEGGNSCGYVQFNTSPFWSGGHCYSIQNIADKVDNMYLYHYLKSNEDAIMKLRIGSGLPNIQKKDLAMFKIIVPKIEWQIKISTFLSSLERKAEIEERIQNVMQKQKLYLLQQMFI
ncbi:MULTISPECIES: restriction endonuclease subunit S [Bacteroidales]|nr:MULTISPECIES: restriction endonuclease subunit S [Bacteroidales]